MITKKRKAKTTKSIQKHFLSILSKFKEIENIRKGVLVKLFDAHFSSNETIILILTFCRNSIVTQLFVVKRNYLMTIQCAFRMQSIQEASAYFLFISFEISFCDIFRVVLFSSF